LEDALAGDSIDTDLLMSFLDDAAGTITIPSWLQEIQTLRNNTARSSDYYQIPES
jgi:hypothetical protein